MRHKRVFISILGVFLLAGLSVRPLQAQTSSPGDTGLKYPWPVYYQDIGNGSRLAYTDRGKGPALLLVHGLGSYIPAWKMNMDALSRVHRVIAVDLPGYGKSSKEVRAYSISFFAQSVAELQDSLGIEKATWIGHSMGGQVAMAAALEYPDKVENLVLIAPAGFETFSENESAFLGSLVTPAAVRATTEPLIRAAFRQSFFNMPESAEFMVQDRIALQQAEDFDGYARAYAGSVRAMLNGPVFNRIDDIRQPVLVIFGRQDALIPNRQLHPEMTTREVAEAGAGKLSRGRVLMVDSAGHFVHFEQPEVVNRSILHFIENGK